MTPKDLRVRRVAAGIPGHGRLSDIEREYVIPAAEELQRIDYAIEQIIRTREQLVKLAIEAGMSLRGVRL